MAMENIAARVTSCLNILPLIVMMVVVMVYQREYKQLLNFHFI